MAEIKIPDEAVEAVARAICAHIGSNWVFDGDPRHSEAREDMMAQGRTAILAGVKAWPGRDVERFMPDSGPYVLHLPLPQDRGGA